MERGTSTSFEAALAERTLVLDGGLASELERRGEDLAGPLWSARLLLERPQAIAEVHEAYYRAGADVVTTASYQASLPGLRATGCSAAEAELVLRRSVELADAVRRRLAVVLGRPLWVAASVGPYGAWLADGSEYRGDYRMDEDGLVEFHHDRLAILSDAGADVLAIETIPSLPEMRALVRALTELPAARAWIAGCCRDGEHLADGSRFAEAVTAAAASPQVVAVGVNCTAPRYVAPLLAHAASETSKSLVAYPNSGESWDPAARRWRPAGGADRAATTWPVDVWRSQGARLVGGCCRTGPEAIRRLRAAVD